MENSIVPAMETTPTSLNGNAVTIMPLGIVEGAVTEYDVTFHYKSGYRYTGTYDFKQSKCFI